MHRTDTDNLAFQNCIVQKAGPTSVTGLTYGLSHSASSHLFQKQQTDSQATDTPQEKKRRGQKQKKKKRKVLHFGQEGIKETGDIDWRQRNGQKEKRAQSEKKSWLGSRLHLVMTHCLQC